MKAACAITLALLGLAGCAGPSTLEGQLAANAGYHAGLRDRITQEGGRNARYLPFWMAADPWSHRGAFGSGPQIGSDSD